MKKILAIFLALACIFAACSCALMPSNEPDAYITTSFTVANDDGTKVLKEFDEVGAEKRTTYAANGKVASVEEFDKDGKLTKRVKYDTDGAFVSCEVREYGPDGKVCKVNDYNEAEKLIAVREYNGELKLIKHTKYYDNGEIRIIQEYDNAGAAVVKTTYYTEDGLGYSVVTADKTTYNTVIKAILLL